jgi:hypothetical protein
MVVVVSEAVVVVGAAVAEVVLAAVVGVVVSTGAELQAVITARTTKICRLTERRLGDR